MSNLESNLGQGIPKKVGQYTLDNKLVKIFNTVTECKKEFTNVKKVLKGMLPFTKNFIFKYSRNSFFQNKYLLLFLYILALK